MALGDAGRDLKRKARLPNCGCIDAETRDNAPAAKRYTRRRR
jgi:hypothetical protein